MATAPPFAREPAGRAAEMQRAALHARLPARLRILYVVPGHHLLPTAGPSRNVLSLAAALARLPGIEPTIAFRRVLQPAVPEGIRVLELEPDGPLPPDPHDDAAMRGIGVGEAARYLRALDRFARRHLPAFDLILEKGWLFSGWLARRALKAGRIGIAIENFVPNLARPEGVGKRLRLALGFSIARRNLRRLPLVIVETEALRRGLMAAYGLLPEQVVVVGLGLDREHFQPRSQEQARRALGIAPDATVLLYVGVLDATHDLWPVLRGLAALAPPARAHLALHVVGEGVRRAAYEAFVREQQLAVQFHGRRPHQEVPVWIAAADLCLAPYDVSVFANHELGYSTLKVREYLACGRPVATVASGVLRSLIRDGESGFLLAHADAAWQALFASLPERARLARMGEVAAMTPLASWEDTARGYLAHALPLLAGWAETRHR